MVDLLAETVDNAFKDKYRSGTAHNCERLPSE